VKTVFQFIVPDRTLRAISKQLVFKQYKDGQVVMKFPDMSNIIASASQRNCGNLFKEAVAFAKAINNDPAPNRYGFLLSGVKTHGQQCVLYLNILRIVGALSGIALSPDRKNLYICNTISGTISKMGTDGSNPQVCCSGILNPRSLIFDPNGKMYVAAYLMQFILFRPMEN